jgi:hypothetical protein
MLYLNADLLTYMMISKIREVLQVPKHEKRTPCLYILNDFQHNGSKMLNPVR